MDGYGFVEVSSPPAAFSPLFYKFVVQFQSLQVGASVVHPFVLLH
jgi:hypothetical protein